MAVAHHLIIEMADAKKTKFLVVDDDESLLDLIEIILDAAGFESTIVSNAPDALKTVSDKSQNLDGVILDLNLQDFPGERMIDDLRRLAPGLPIYITSGCLAEEIHERLEGRQVDGIITKPFRSADLTSKLRTGLEQRSIQEPSSEGA